MPPLTSALPAAARSPGRSRRPARVWRRDRRPISAVAVVVALRHERRLRGVVPIALLVLREQARTAAGKPAERGTTERPGAGLMPPCGYP